MSINMYILMCMPIFPEQVASTARRSRPSRTWQVHMEDLCGEYRNTR